MWRRLVRGAIVGIFIGVVAGMAISSGIYIKNIAAERLSGISTASEEGSSSLWDITLRFHVRGNSSSEEDLELKYEVRDAVLAAIGDDLAMCESVEEAEQFVADSIDSIQSIAINVVGESGYDYNVRAYLAYDTFPIRQYGELVLPAGTYLALRIDIGEAEGENFWCLLYPLMCYSIDDGAVASRCAGEIFYQKLTYDEYNRLFIKHDTSDKSVRVRFKLLEWLGL